jgi:hypothetical protein
VIPARLYAGLAGATLALGGIAGFFYSASLGSPGDVEAMFGIFDVNGWLNAVHIVTGALGLVAFAADARAARRYALALGAFYVAVAIWGFAIGDDDSILGIIPGNTGNNLLHLMLGSIGLATVLTGHRDTPGQALK